ncbi:hypothetical protein [Variovorax sp. ZT5P30]
MGVAFAATMWMVVLSGCSGVRLYRAGEDDVAKKAVTAIADADLKNALVPERVALKEFAKTEQEAVQRDQLARRDSRLVAWLSATSKDYSWTSMQEHVTRRIDTLVGSAGDSLRIEANVRLARESLDFLELEQQTYLAASKGMLLKCPTPSTQRPAPGTELATSFRTFDNACKKHTTAIADLATAFASGGGELSRLAREIQEIKIAREDIAKAVTKAKQEYATALAATKAPSAGSDTSRALADLKAKFDKLGELPNAGKFSGDAVLSRLADAGALEQLKEKLRLIRELIASINGTKGAESQTATQKRAAAVGALLGALTTEPAPPLTALLLQAEFLRQEAAGLELRIARADQKVELLGAKQASMQGELLFLNDVNKSLDQFSKQCPKVASLYESYRRANSNCKLLLARALAGYMNAATFGQTQQELLDYQLIALGHEIALDDSEVAFGQADSLIRLPVNQLSKAYGSGIKPEEIGNLVNAIGLGAIAVRVK